MQLDWNGSDHDLAAALPGRFLGKPKRGPLTGGRTIGLRNLAEYEVAAYGRTRNHLEGAVSRLSPYIRHGMLGLVEVRDALKAKHPHEPKLTEEFFRQLAWHGIGLRDDIEAAKHGVERRERIPLDVLRGETGLPCIDGMLAELFDTGYLHNHERLWFAAYLCHFRGIRWTEGARLFRQHLYDGDEASNTSSWQWVESTFASKPYFMNKQNIDGFSSARWCRDCAAKCPFDASYEALQHSLFGGSHAPLDRGERPSQDIAPSPPPIAASTFEVPETDAVVWLHDAALSWDEPALKANPNAAVLFAFDASSLAEEPWAFHRLAFVRDGVREVFERIPNATKLLVAGNTLEEVRALMKATAATTLHVTEHPNTAVVGVIETLKQEFSVIVHPRPTFASYADEPRRFSRYWEKVAPQVLGYSPKANKRLHQ